MFFRFLFQTSRKFTAFCKMLLFSLHCLARLTSRTSWGKIYKKDRSSDTRTRLFPRMLSTNRKGQWVAYLPTGPLKIWLLFNGEESFGKSVEISADYRLSFKRARKVKGPLVRQPDFLWFIAPRFQIWKGKTAKEKETFCRSGHAREEQFSNRHFTSHVL